MKYILKCLSKISQTSAVLPERIFRAAFIAGHVWHNALVFSPDLPQPNECVWMCIWDGHQPLWTKLPEAPTWFNSKSKVHSVNANVELDVASALKQTLHDQKFVDAMVTVVRQNVYQHISSKHSHFIIL